MAGAFRYPTCCCTLHYEQCCGALRPATVTFVPNIDLWQDELNRAARLALESVAARLEMSVWDVIVQLDTGEMAIARKGA